MVDPTVAVHAFSSVARTGRDDDFGPWAEPSDSQLGVEFAQVPYCRAMFACDERKWLCPSDAVCEGLFCWRCPLDSGDAN